MNSLRSFLAGIVDYAGLFPPAALEMDSAVRSYGAYRVGSDRDLLGRFVLPAARLNEFAAAAGPLLQRGDAPDPWKLSVLVGDDVVEASESILEFNCNHGSGSKLGHALCDSVEIHAHTEGDITRASAAFPELRLFFELALEPDPRPLLRAVAARSRYASAKIRTGGVTEQAFPPSEPIVRFIRECSELGVSFKATAGLHHAVRAAYPLTYEDNSPTATMFGYLNLFLAAAFVRQGLPDTEAREILEERSIDAFTFNDEGAQWRQHNVTVGELSATRKELALSFGSCSFLEPVGEARSLHLI